MRVGQHPDRGPTGPPRRHHAPDNDVRRGAPNSIDDVFAKAKSEYSKADEVTVEYDPARTALEVIVAEITELGYTAEVA